MAAQPLVKVYASFSPVGENCRDSVATVGRQAVGCDEPWLFMENGLLRIAWEGIWFPLDDVLAILAIHLSPDAEGKLDFLDMEAWTLTRCLFVNGAFDCQTRGLNHVLAYSGF